MKKILFINLNGLDDGNFGGPKGTIRNFEALKRYADVDAIQIKRKSTLKSGISILQGFYPPINRCDLKKIHKMVSEVNYDLVFFDSSVYGRIISCVKKMGIKVAVFYHNCEFDYVDVRIQNNMLKNRIYKFLARISEKTASENSDFRIVFTDRDKQRIENLYNCSVDYVIPLGIRDQYKAIEQNKSTKEKYCLLLGVLCSANLEGYDWFRREVSPKLNCKTIIAGKGFEKYEIQWKTNKVQVIGFVDDLNSIYEDALCVAIPLFSGGGMKVKTAEALMFGKYIFGTDEAFVGFELDDNQVGGRCNKADEFIDKINKLINNTDDFSNSYSRELYERKYSVSASLKEFKDLIDKI